MRADGNIKSRSGSESFESKAENNLHDAEDEPNHRGLSRNTKQEQQEYGRMGQEQINNTGTDDHAGGCGSGLIQAVQGSSSLEQDLSSVRVPRQSEKEDVDSGIDENDHNRDGGAGRTEREKASISHSNVDGVRIGSKQGSGEHMREGMEGNANRNSSSSVSRDGEPLSGVGISSSSSSNAGIPPSQPCPSLSSYRLDPGESSQEATHKGEGGRVAGGGQPDERAGRGDVQTGAGEHKEGT